MHQDQLSDLKYAELQAIAKKHGIRANGGKEHLVQQLATYFEEQAAPSTSRTTRSTSQSFKRRLVDQDLSTEDEAADPKVSSTDLPVSRRTRSGHHSPRTPSINTPAGSARRTRSRVVSSVAPRAALTRTTSQSRPKQTTAFDSATDLESSAANATPPPPLLSRRKALDSQRRLGVGRPKAIGGSGVRKSTARAKSTTVKPLSNGRIVEVVVPTLQAVREEEAAAASRVSLSKPRPTESLEQEEEEDDDDERTSTPPPPPLRTKPVPGASKSDAHDTTVRVLLSALEGRIEKTESALDTERRRVASLSARVARLEAENRRLRDDLDVLNQHIESGAEKQVVSETPQTPSSREPTPTREKENQQLPEAPPTHAVLPLASQSDDDNALRPTSTDSPSQPAEAAFPKVLHPPPSSNSRSHSPIPPKSITPAGAKALSNRLRTLEPPTTGQSAANRSSQTIGRPQSPAPARKTLGKHPRDGPDLLEAEDENGQANLSVNRGPNKRRRVDAEQQVEGEAQDIDMDGEPVNMGAQGASENASAVSPSTRPVASTRASSQPLRSAKGGRPSSRTSIEPESSRGTRRRTRAGSADPTLSGPHQRVSVAIRGLETVAEGDFAANAAGPSSSPQQPVSLAPIDPLPLPRTQDASLPPFVSYPLPGDPVKQLKPLTHFDSGTEFFGTQSKRNYRTDWHEGTVFDDPFDAETVRRAQGIAAEEVQGGFGPQGLDGIADGLEERDEQESLGMRGMMSFVGEGDTGVDLS